MRPLCLISYSASDHQGCFAHVLSSRYHLTVGLGEFPETDHFLSLLFCQPTLLAPQTRPILHASRWTPCREGNRACGNSFLEIRLAARQCRPSSNPRF